ncbi:fibrobacter succinogenes major paralogous domain-containing protein [Fibrobacter sp.]|uniref:fibrobacter succinogenes major paralogous domain-containing protein n=1 Tax=Fibrobacter sp. TaxID=35828 RepID=UPI00386912FC
MDWPTDSIIDDRDGQKYKIVKIDRLWWFAQNLNYETENSHCYNDSTKYCDKYGRLYTWAAAVGKSEEECGERHVCNLSLPVQGVCPSGWHVPSNYEWNDLFVFVGGDKVAGEVLRNSSEGGFALLYAGRINFAGDFVQEGRSACIWSSNEVDDYDSYYVDFYYTYSKVFLEDADKTDGYSVRCVKDES